MLLVNLSHDTAVSGMDFAALLNVYIARLDTIAQTSANTSRLLQLLLAGVSATGYSSTVVDRRYNGMRLDSACYSIEDGS
jgi:hypothetical protein